MAMSRMTRAILASEEGDEGDVIDSLMGFEGLGDPGAKSRGSRARRRTMRRGRRAIRRGGRGRGGPGIRIPTLGGREEFAPRRRRRGISATQLKGFNRVVALLRKVGMVPKGIRGARRRPCR